MSLAVARLQTLVWPSNIRRSEQFYGDVLGLPLTGNFPGFAHDEAGVWAAPDGTKVAWFRDSDGNLISLVGYAA